MKKLAKNTAITFLAAVLAIGQSSCATILGGRITTCQTTKKADQARQVQVGYLVADVLLGLVPLVVDFVDAAIYKPCANHSSPLKTITK